MALITGAQLRAARGLTNLSILQLSEMTGLSINTIKRAEGTNLEVPVNAANARALRSALERLGVAFLEPSGDEGHGVRFSSGEPPAFAPRRRPVHD